MTTNVLVPLSDSVSSRAVVDYLVNLPFCPEDWNVVLMHLFRKPSASEELMGKKFTEEMSARYQDVLEKAQDRLIEAGFTPDHITIKMISEPYPTISDGIIDQFRKDKYDMVVIGRKRMTKAEEFVMGDVSVKLLRALEGAAILVVKSK
ncbi:universal stress protein [Desulfatiglans anilini]|uniref:universal stress protein n=1 Tax=Desulfatiglans anilini TaxID=90728 RepID=UPI000482A491|nr:universal stress protein [Desulfatiglans anilini]